MQTALKDGNLMKNKPKAVKKDMISQLGAVAEKGHYADAIRGSSMQHNGQE